MSPSPANPSAADRARDGIDVDGLLRPEEVVIAALAPRQFDIELLATADGRGRSMAHASNRARSVSLIGLFGSARAPRPRSSRRPCARTSSARSSLARGG
jgi:hypothetical protein